jgi:hypothetical protein
MTSFHLDFESQGWKDAMENLVCLEARSERKQTNHIKTENRSGFLILDEMQCS